MYGIDPVRVTLLPDTATRSTSATSGVQAPLPATAAATDEAIQPETHVFVRRRTVQIGPDEFGLIQVFTFRPHATFKPVRAPPKPECV